MTPLLSPPALLLRPIYTISQQANGEESNSWLVGMMMIIAFVLVLAVVFLRRRRP